jgi:hypothetical protein
MAKTRDDKIVEFGDDFTAKVGTVLKDAQSSIAGIFDPNADSSVSKIVGGLKNLNEPASPEDITTEILSRGRIKFEFPKPVRDFPEEAIEVLNTMVTALETLKTILEAIRDLIVGLSDLLKNLLESIFSIIEDLINMFTSVNCAVRVLPIPPIHPSNIDANSYTLTDAVVAAAFAELVIGAYGDTEITKAYPGVPREDIENKLLGNFGPSARYKDGSSGFLAAINDSFEDKKDPNRPVEPVGFSAGLVVHAGAPTASIINAWIQIKKVITGIKKDLKIPKEPTVSPRVEILETVHTGFDESGNPTVRLKMSNPNKIAPKNLMQLPTKIYLPTELTVLTVQNTDASPYSKIREQGEADLRRFKNLTLTDTDGIAYFKVENVKYDANVTFGYLKNTSTGDESVPVLSFTTFQEPTITLTTAYPKRLLSFNSADAENRPVDVLYKIVRKFQEYNLEGDRYVSKAGEEKTISCFSNTVPLHITLDPNSFGPVLSEGAAPNWLQYGGTWQIPGTEDIIRKLRDFVDDLKAYISTSSNILVAVVNTYIALIDKLIMLISRLRNIVLIIDDILDTTIGGNYFTFTCDNGVSGIKKSINDYFDEQKSAYFEARNAGSDVSQIDWFADGESVCGAVIVGTSQTAEQVYRLIELLELLFGKSSDTDTSGQRLLSETVLENKQFVFGQDPIEPKELFIDNFTGVDSSRHSESPENACPDD